MTFSTRRQLASKINENTDVLWTDSSLGEVTDAILSEFVVIPRSELPEVTDTSNTLGVHGTSYSKIITREVRRADALIHLALAEYLEAEEAGREAQEAKRNARRNELARQFSASQYTLHSKLSSIAQKAIDRIIELEEAQDTP